MSFDAGEECKTGAGRSEQNGFNAKILLPAVILFILLISPQPTIRHYVRSVSIDKHA